MVVIIDYGMGNIRSIQNALDYLGVESIVSAEKEKIVQAERIILPGVGSFHRAMSIISESSLDLYLKQAVLENSIPILGICLGMQLLGRSSTEDGLSKGLALVEFDVDKFNVSDTIKVPHVGFNTVKVDNTSPLYRNFSASNDFYFTHSYRMVRNDNEDNNNEGDNSAVTNIVNGICEYGESFIASFQHNHICGTQFHPEKSHSNGLKLLQNFIEIV